MVLWWEVLGSWVEAVDSECGQARVGCGVGTEDVWVSEAESRRGRGKDPRGTAVREKGRRTRTTGVTPEVGGLSGHQ